MKAIIPVAGPGTKLRPHSYTQPKALIPLAGRSILGIIIDQLQEAGISEFIFVVGYLGEKIEDFVAQHYPGINAHFLQQTDRQGVGHAVLLAREQVAGDEIFIVLGDTICEYDIKSVMDSSRSMIGLRKVDDPRDFGVAEVNEDGFIARLVEKPQMPKSNLALVGVYKIKESEELFRCLENNISHGLRAHGEYSITDALECMIQKGIPLQSFKVDNWFDCGRKETLLESNALLLKKFAPAIDASAFVNTVIVPPVSIGAGCQISNAVIGPDVTIGDHTRIDCSVVRNSIIGSYSHLHDIVVSDSLIGSDTDCKGEARSLNIGDNATIDLG
ncbi:MAG: glucose-1-phosphate thymidylyltransferase [Chitinophagales bacterium]|jgi:glucose-1-phosphate thymidylyltransferase|nr:glucose-1-phosphate thymidylyltransferase [Chitinophagales bacterium]